MREGTTDWGHLALPSVLYLNTLVLLASSAALEFSRRSLAPARLTEPGSARKSSAWLLLALFLGLAFCLGQYSAWQQLRTQGVYLASNPNSSFFYVPRHHSSRPGSLQCRLRSHLLHASRRGTS